MADFEAGSLRGHLFLELRIDLRIGEAQPLDKNRGFT